MTVLTVWCRSLNDSLFDLKATTAVPATTAPAARRPATFDSFAAAAAAGTERARAPPPSSAAPASAGVPAAAAAAGPGPQAIDGREFFTMAQARLSYDKVGRGRRCGSRGTAHARVG
jgi:hypothetical protein